MAKELTIDEQVADLQRAMTNLAELAQTVRIKVDLIAESMGPRKAEETPDA